jgi:hypothetical protein
MRFGGAHVPVAESTLALSVILLLDRISSHEIFR